MSLQKPKNTLPILSQITHAMPARHNARDIAPHIALSPGEATGYQMTGLEHCPGAAAVREAAVHQTHHANLSKSSQLRNLPHTHTFILKRLGVTAGVIVSLPLR
jgi:hypothetical protein